MTLRPAFLGVAVTLSAFAVGAADAATLTSLNRATFQTAVAGATSLGQQNFDTLVAGSTLTSDGFVTYGSSSGTPLVTGSFLTSSGANGLGHTGAGYFLSGDTASFSFLNPITAFAIDINTFATAAASYSVLLNIGDTANSVFETFPGTGTGQFIGFTSDTPFSSLVLQSNGGFAYSLDTLIYGESAAVTGPMTGAAPEPGTWAMMIGGFGMAGGALRRRKSSVTTRVTYAV